MKNSAQQVAYREFRAKVIGESYMRDRHLYSGDQAYPFRKRRDTIEAFRRYLDYHAGTIIQNTPESESHLRKALRIPQHIPLRVTKIMKFGQFMLGFLPDRFLASRAKILISPVGSYEGRAVVYSPQRKTDILLGGLQRDLRFCDNASPSQRDVQRRASYATC